VQKPRRTSAALALVLLVVPISAALTQAPDNEALLRIEPVIVQRDAEWQDRRAKIGHAVEHYGIDRELAADIYDLAQEEGIPPGIAFALVQVESEYDERAVSPEGARGLTQLMPATARYLEPQLREEELFDRRTNLRLGFRYLRMMLTRYDDDLRLALLAYNRGPGTVSRHLAQGEDPGNGFARRVLTAQTGREQGTGSR
jgi:soluble lytic murein transglycosylase-like protein